MHGYVASRSKTLKPQIQRLSNVKCNAKTNQIAKYDAKYLKTNIIHYSDIDNIFLFISSFYLLTDRAYSNIGSLETHGLHS